MITKRDYIDASDKFKWKWFFQSLMYKDVSYYRNIYGKWVREVKGVQGQWEGGRFYPNKNKIVNYIQ